MVFVTIASDAESQALHDLTRHAIGRVAARAWMVIWSAERVEATQIAHRLHCQPKTVCKWLARFTAGGAAALADLPRTDRPSQVTPVAEQAVFTQLNQPPSCCGYVFAIWTVGRLCQHLRERCALNLSGWRVRLVLHSLRYRFTRPKVAPRRVDPRRAEINQQIGRRIAEVSAETVVMVEDETDIRLFPVRRRTWQRIGEQLRLVAPMQNKKRTVFGAIEVHTGAVFHRLFERKRTAEMISFLTDLAQHYGGRPVLMMLDQASIHKSRALRDWLAEQPQIELIYLPKFGGHQDNPVEKLWWHLKGYVTANRCCRCITELVSVVERYFAHLTPEKVIQLVA